MTSITALTKFVMPIKTFINNKDWICQSVPCFIVSQTEERVCVKPFNKSAKISVSLLDFNELFINLESDGTYVYVDSYPSGRISISEFQVKKISLNPLIKHFSNNPEFVSLIKKVEQDSYAGKGSSKCVSLVEYNNFISSPPLTILERIGDPIFNRTTRHTTPILSSFTRTNFEASPSFPAPIGIRSSDFSLPSEQNELLIELLTQLFNSVDSPECPENIKCGLGLSITPASHVCLWCCEKLSLANLNQVYCSTEHSINLCHRDPNVGTKKGNVYWGHCSCNREQGGYSEEERINQLIRLIKANPKYKEQVLLDLTS
jgi:hypothetical protein